MKEGGDWTSEGHGSTTSEDRAIIPEWASLLPELVQRIADHVLSTTAGVDAYMDMRAVCPSWRPAITKPSPLAAVADLRFRPRHWIMLDLWQRTDDPRLFLHTPTGRFRRLRLPVFLDHTFAGTSDGLLVLGDRYSSPRTAHVLNPFTGDMLDFAAEIPRHVNKNAAYTSVNGGSHSTLVLLKGGTLFSAAPISDIFAEKFANTYSCFVSILNFQGNVYCADRDGCVFKYVSPADQCDDELVLIAKLFPDYDTYEACYTMEWRFSYLVESAGELLLVRYVDHILKVYRVDVVEHTLSVEVKSLGGHTLFLGEERCVSVDADKLPSVNGDCIYVTFSGFKDCMCVYSIRGDMVDVMFRKDLLDRPYSLVTLLLEYCDYRSQML